jgi:hypothetical protein
MFLRNAARRHIPEYGILHTSTSPHGADMATAAGDGPCTAPPSVLTGSRDTASRPGRFTLQARTHRAHCTGVR